MTERYYSIAGITVKMCMEKDESLQMFEEFELISDREILPELTVEVWQEQNAFHQWYGVDYCRAEEKRPHLFVSRRYPKVRLTADENWEDYVIEGAKYGIDGVMEVFLCAFYSWISLRGGILIHASCVAFEREGIIFTAPSGTGKTTQAELWEKYRSAEILNGDKAVIDCGSGDPMLWGTPWRGSSLYAVNKSVPLKAVVVLAQGEKNEICRLEGADAVSGFFPHVFFPSWSEECVNNVMRSLDGLLRRIPVYFLSCLPDEGAVELTCQMIWGEDIR